MQAANQTFNSAGTTHPVTGTCPAQTIIVTRSTNVAVGVTNATAGGSAGVTAAYWQPHTAVNFIIKY
jgi:hypothetical protein